jgi:hypothetical protein
MKRGIFWFKTALLVVLGVQLACNATNPVVDGATQTVAPVIPSSTVVASTITSSPIPSPTETATPAPTATSELTATSVPTVAPTIPVTPPAPGKAAAVGRVLWNEQPASKTAVRICKDFSSYIGCSGKRYGTYTDKEGYYIFNNVDPGNYVVLVDVAHDFWLYQEQGNQLKIRLAVEEALVSGEITRIDDRNIYKTDLRLLYPPGGKSISEAKPVLKWKDYPGAAYYEISLEDSARILENYRVDTNEYALENPLPNCKYSWRVSAYNAKGMKIAISTGVFDNFRIIGQPTSCESNK